MNLDAIGATGDLISGIGVIVRWLYLTAQIGEATRAIRTSTANTTLCTA